MIYGLNVPDCIHANFLLKIGMAIIAMNREPSLAFSHIAVKKDSLWSTLGIVQRLFSLTVCIPNPFSRHVYKKWNVLLFDYKKTIIAYHKFDTICQVIELLLFIKYIFSLYILSTMWQTWINNDKKKTITRFPCGTVKENSRYGLNQIFGTVPKIRP